MIIHSDGRTAMHIHLRLNNGFFLKLVIPFPNQISYAFHYFLNVIKLTVILVNLIQINIWLIFE